MITVYFETNNFGFADEVAKFSDDALYIKCLPVLEAYAHECGYDKVTESEA